jgi:cell wall-associated NlpC family hydrolase
MLSPAAIIDGRHVGILTCEPSQIDESRFRRPQKGMVAVCGGGEKVPGHVAVVVDRGRFFLVVQSGDPQIVHASYNSPAAGGV